jgi:hypothetical protein
MSYSQIKSQQTLCETVSPRFAVHGTGDCENTASVQTDSQQPKSNHGKQHVTLRGNGPKFAVVDQADLALVAPHKWRAHLNHKTWYAVSSKGVLMHRLIAGISHLGRAVEVDHKDGDGLNNTRDNIRIVRRSVNLQNRRKFSNSNKSKYVGIKPSQNGKKWLARIYLNKKPILLGTHATELEAARAYDIAALKLYGPEARLNVPVPCPTNFPPPPCGTNHQATKAETGRDRG